ncbi:MAG TPA: hypothetical protein DDW27_18910 [Bacteroidales bacterium]|nr:hypothetical protein [Bacteroidales bacterium]
MEKKEKIVYVVHSIDTEGPLYESLYATFERIQRIFGLQIEPTQENLSKLQNYEIDLGGMEKQVARVVAPQLIEYINDYGKLGNMLERIGSREYRNMLPDSFGGGWIYNWHCVDHIGYEDNPRRRDIGIHNIFDYYAEFIRRTNAPDAIHWHFHPTHHRCIANLNVNTWLRDDKFFKILARRVIERNWFPSVNRAGYHTERPDSHWVLEQWIPFDLSNQAFAGDDGQMDVSGGRFGDWRRAPDDWSIYQPHHDDYQIPGNCRRYIARCLNVGTRMRNINEAEVRKAFLHARENGNTLMAFTNHDFREMSNDIGYVRALLKKVSPEFPDVKYKFAEAIESFNKVIFGNYEIPESRLFNINLTENPDIGNHILKVASNRPIFGPQPFLAIETRDGNFFTDNFDIQVANQKWSYTFDEHTFKYDQLRKIGVASNDNHGFFDTEVITI